MKREFKICETTSGTTKKIIRFFVTDAIGQDEIDTRSVVAEFPISELYDEETQLHHARLFRDFMDKIEEAKQVAYEQTMLVDILKK
jgi:hypothetical protein